MQITLDVPDQFGLDYTPSELANHIKLYAALAMFQAGRISAGFACEFSGVDRYRFYEECAKHKIPAIDYEPGELEAELEALRDL